VDDFSTFSAVTSAVFFYSTYSTEYTSDITATPDDDDEERCRADASCRGAAVVDGFSEFRIFEQTCSQQ
jgi:hypothetical protein